MYELTILVMAIPQNVNNGSTDMAQRLNLPKRILLHSLERVRDGQGTDVYKRHHLYDKLDFSKEMGAKCVVALSVIKSRSDPVSINTVIHLLGHEYE